MQNMVQLKNAPYLLSGWSVVMSIIGIMYQGIEPLKAVSLIFALLVFSLLLICSFEVWLAERSKNPEKAKALVGFMIVFSLIEASLLHYGLLWVAEDQVGEYGAWFASFIFIYIALFAKWAYTPTPVAEPEQEKVEAGPPLKQAADLLEGVSSE